MKSRRIRSFASKEVSVTPGPAVSSSEKVAFIRQGKKKKTITKYQQNKNVTYRNQGDQIIVVEKEKQFDETGVARKKRNYVMYESKLGTEKERDISKITAKKIRKPEPRMFERIEQKKTRREILDNYQYHETKVIKEPHNASYVFHQRLSEPIGGVYETKTYERKVIKTNDGNSGFKQTTTRSRNWPNTNVPNSLTFNRKIKTQNENLSNSTASRYKRPIKNAVTNETTFKRIYRKSRNSDVPTETENSKSQRENRSNILKDTDNTLLQKEIEKTENVISQKEPEKAGVKEINIVIKKEIETESSQPQNENEITEYKKYEKTVTTDVNGNTTTITKTTIEKGEDEK